MKERESIATPRSKRIETPSITFTIYPLNQRSYSDHKSKFTFSVSKTSIYINYRPISLRPKSEESLANLEKNRLSNEAKKSLEVST